MRIRLAFALPLAALVAVACTAPDEDDVGASDQAHSARSYVHENSPYFWASSSYEDFRTIQAQIGSTFTAPPLPEGSAIELRLQTWLDRIDAIVRPEVERQSGRPLPAPRPIAKVIHSAATYNAWVSGGLACTGMSLGATPSSPAAAGSSAYLDLGGVQLATGLTCARSSEWTPAGFAAFWNAAKPACSLRPTEGGGYDVAGTCQVSPGATPAADTMVIATAPYIQFSTDLLMELDENTVALVAAHELGHYYLAHGTSVGWSKYNYWYALGERQQVAPARATNAADLEAAYKEVVSPTAVAPLAFGKKYSARLRPLLLTGIAPLLQERTEQDFACAPARDALGAWTADALGGAPTPEARAAFEAFEKKLAACAPQLALGEAGPRALSAGQVLFAAGRSRPGPKVKPTMQLGDTLAAFLDRLDVKAKELDGKAARLVQRARQNGFGLYTTEQAADDFAVEIATKLGLSSEEVLGAWTSFMEASDRRWSVGYTPEAYEAAMKAAGEQTARSCKALLDAGFTTVDASGRRVPVTMSMGRLDEPHHASCYRLYNMWRELRAHRFEPGPRGPALEPAWSTLQAEAARLSHAAPDAQPTPAP